MADVKTMSHSIYGDEGESSRRFSFASFVGSTRGLTKKERNFNHKYSQPNAEALAAASETDRILVPVHLDHLPRRARYDVLARVNDRLQPGVGANEDFRLLRMSKVEYQKYWARDESGQYIGTEPEGEGHARLKAQGW